MSIPDLVAWAEARAQQQQELAEIWQGGGRRLRPRNERGRRRRNTDGQQGNPPTEGENLMSIVTDQWTDEALDRLGAAVKATRSARCARCGERVPTEHVCTETPISRTELVQRIRKDIIETRDHVMQVVGGVPL